MVERIGGVDDGCAVDGDADRHIQLGVDPGAAVAGEPWGSIAGDGADDAGRSDFAGPVIALVGDVEVAVEIDGDIGGVKEGGAVAATPSESKPPKPLPATVLMTPAGVTLRMR